MGLYIATSCPESNRTTTLLVWLMHIFFILYFLLYLWTMSNFRCLFVGLRYGFRAKKRARVDRLTSVRTHLAGWLYDSRSRRSKNSITKYVFYAIRSFALINVRWMSIVVQMYIVCMQYLYGCPMNVTDFVFDKTSTVGGNWIEFHVRICWRSHCRLDATREPFLLMPRSIEINFDKSQPPITPILYCVFEYE